MKSEIDGAKGFRRLIPSMTALIEFEAVARLGSFTLAADEIGVTQAAVSRQIRELEDGLGGRLFHRLHRSNILTSEGEALYKIVSTSLRNIAGGLDRLSRGSEQQELVLATTAAFSHFRLLPKLSGLRELMPHLTIRLTTQMFMADLRQKEIDVAVRYGDGKWQDGTSFLLFQEEVFPVCSPQWLEAHGTPGGLKELAESSLIDYDSTSEGWMAWEEWFRAVGTVPSQMHFAFRCTLYTDAIMAARHGQGIALGWARLLQDLLASGELVRLTDESFKVKDAYYAVVPHGRSISPTVEKLIDWMRREASDPSEE
ncbi:DNA-binding transcriptional LysR family regulator [Paraburkholderia youngii]|uniref:LysR substrate-binding domain-containing protein n=1 Tax=Paraburkholderia youngii TaxID=2782701 RepID=UPI003D20255C